MDFLLNFILHIDQYMVMIVRDYHAWTYAILFIIIFCETGLVVTPFLPGDSLLFVAGAISALPDMPISIHILVIILFAAAILGDSCNYMIGHFFGRRLFNNPKSKIFKQSHLEKTHEFYKKYGGKTIILARFIPIVRTFAPFVAGMGKMNYYYFMMYNLVGGKIEKENDGLSEAYRELYEETNISKSDVRLEYFMNIEYVVFDKILEVYYGILNKEVNLIEEVNKLEWVNIDDNFFDMKKYAGEGNIGHIIEEIKISLKSK